MMVEVQHFFSFLPGLPCGSHRLLGDFWEETLWGLWSHSLKANLCLSYLGNPSSLWPFFFFGAVPIGNGWDTGTCGTSPRFLQRSLLMRAPAGRPLVWIYHNPSNFTMQNVFFKFTVLCVVKINADYFYFCPPDMFDMIIVGDRWLSRDAFVGCVWNKGVDGLPAVGILFLPRVKLSCPDRSLGREVHLCKFQITFRK